VLATRPYSDEIASIMSELMKRSPEYQHPYLQVRDVKRRVIILVTADRGLAGALNSNNTRLALRATNELQVPHRVRDHRTQGPRRDPARAQRPHRRPQQPG